MDIVVLKGKLVEKTQKYRRYELVDRLEIGGKLVRGFWLNKERGKTKRLGLLLEGELVKES